MTIAKTITKTTKNENTKDINISNKKRNNDDTNDKSNT